MKEIITILQTEKVGHKEIKAQGPNLAKTQSYA